MGRTRGFRKQPGHRMDWNRHLGHRSVSFLKFMNIDGDSHPK